MKDKNDLIAKDRIDLGVEAPLEWPLAIYVEPSGYCNFKCRFCVHSQNGLKQENMSLDLFKKLIDEITMWDFVVPKMRFCGFGESVINKDFCDMLSYAKLCGGVSCTELVTNGSLINRKLALEIPKYLDDIIISIEGLNSQEYWDITGAQVDFDKLVDDLTFLYQHRAECKIYIKIHNNAIAGNIKKAEKFFDIFSPISDRCWIENLSDMFPGFESDMIDKYNDLFRWNVAEKGEAKVIEHKVCPQVFKAVQIYANGDCVLCCYDWERKNLIGNLNEATLYEIWHSEKADNIRKKHLMFQKQQFEPCKDCKANDFNEVDNIDLCAEKILERLQRQMYESERERNGEDQKK